MRHEYGWYNCRNITLLDNRLHKSGDTQRGVILFDKSTYETTLQALATDFRTIGHRWGILRNFSEVPLFMDSRASRLIQLADLIAYAVFRYYESGDDKFFNIIKSRFDSEGGITHGLHVRDWYPGLNRTKRRHASEYSSARKLIG